jgi:hypothetical protein
MWMLNLMNWNRQKKCRPEQGYAELKSRALLAVKGMKMKAGVALPSAAEMMTDMGRKMSRLPAAAEVMTGMGRKMSRLPAVVEVKIDTALKHRLASGGLVQAQNARQQAGQTSGMIRP